MYKIMYAGSKEIQYMFCMEHAPYMNEAVANIIKALRDKADYSQEQLAGFAKTSRSQIAQLEAGTRGVTLSSLFWIADSFGIPFLELVSMIAEERDRLGGQTQQD